MMDKSYKKLEEDYNKLDNDFYQIKYEIKTLKVFAKADAIQKNKMEEVLVELKEEIIDASDKPFEKAKTQVIFLYSNLDLGKLDLFKVIYYDRL